MEQGTITLYDKQRPAFGRTNDAWEEKPMKKIPVVMDVDTGTDDAIAIICALMSRDQLDIKAITAVAGNVPLSATASNTLNIVDLLGHTDIPVAKGADRPLKRELQCSVSHGATGFGDVVIPASARPFCEKDAAQLLHDIAVDCAGELIYIGTAPQTNLATALQRYPNLVGLIKKVYLMGGCLVGGNTTQASEFNAYADPEAMKIVFRSGLDVTMVGLDVTLKTAVPMWVKEAVERVETPEAQLAAQVIDFCLRRNKEWGYDEANLHDVVAFCALVNPSVLTFKKYYMDVETEGTITRGMTVADFRDVCPDKEKNVWCAEDIDLGRFWRWFVDLFQTYEKK